MIKRAIFLLIVAASAAFLVGCEEEAINNAGLESEQGYQQTVDSSDKSSQDADLQEKAKSHSMFQTTTPQAGEKIAIITTNKGVIKARLFDKKVPETVKNFEELAKADKYDGTVFHRVINEFMIQGGDFENSDGTGGYSYKGPNTTIEDEFDQDLRHIKGALSMANSGPDTNGSQFFIVQADSTPWLDGKHSVFGQVYEGLDIVDAIANVEIGVRDRPVEDVIIEDIEVKAFE